MAARPPEPLAARASSAPGDRATPTFSAGSHPRRRAEDHFTVITLPAYKAQDTLERTIGALPAGSADHLLLVDDASPDGTVDVARRLGIDVRVHDVNRGYGANQKTCYREALDLGATVIVLLHPDYQYDPSAVPALVAPIVAGVADFTFGSRFACTGNPRAGGMPLYRYVGGVNARTPTSTFTPPLTSAETTPAMAALSANAFSSDVQSFGLSTLIRESS